ETYGIDLTARYLGELVPHPIGKGSGQLSLNPGQLEDDAAAGLAFAVLKTVIAEVATGARAMAAWAIHETKMKVERRPAGAGREPPLLVEKDFSPTLAGDALADDRAQILRWLVEVPRQIRAASPVPVRVAVKLMNARFDDRFQVDMMNACREADALVVFNRLFDAERGVAYG